MRKTAAALALAAVLPLAGCAIPAAPPPVQPAEGASGDGDTTRPKAKSPIGLSARRTTAKKSLLSDGGPLTCVAVTVTNRTRDRQIKVNVLYFAITGTDDVKRDASSAHGDYEGAIDLMTLAPGEKARGKVCVAGRFTPKTVSMTNPALETAARARVAQ